MKTVFIPAKFKSKVNKSKILEVSKKLPKRLVIAYSVQFQDIAKEIKQILSKDNHDILGFKQVLGCSKPSFPKATQAVLLISTGRFHAISLTYGINLPIYILDRNELHKINEQDLKALKAKQKAAYVRFLNASHVGVLASVKPGQNRLKRALELKNKLADSNSTNSNKKSYVFLASNIVPSEFENFPSIDSWVNTACPRLDMESSSIINIASLKEQNA